jgi:hypothetical protein
MYGKPIGQYVTEMNVASKTIWKKRQIRLMLIVAGNQMYKKKETDETTSRSGQPNV